MKFSATCIFLFATAPFIVKAENNDPPRKKKRGSYLIELPASLNTSTDSAKNITLFQSSELPFKPSIQVGAIVHMFASGEQTGFSAPSNDKTAKDWNKGFSVYRARVLVGGQLTKKASFFMETEIPSPIGIQSNGEKNVKVAPIILDAQLEYTFNPAFQLIAGMQLVSNNRNGLQGAAGLMANDFTFFQYPYNLFANSPLQGNFGRDLGINARGFLANDKLEYRLGVFTGRNVDGGAPLRTVGRVAYNFLDAEKDYYYAGTKLGNGKTLAWAAGVDAQANYYNLSTDVFFDHPLGNAGSITLNAAYQYMTGGTQTDSKYSFATLIPKQNVQFLELGYYFKKSKLQPWIRYENQDVNADAAQTGAVKPANFDKLKSSTVMGGGLNYFFNGTGTNLRLSYTARTYNVATAIPDDYTKKTFGQVWLQAQFFIF
ncbi:hypothetical protein HGH93_30510 [Chitinophaga polysaccharea]|uniref:hypothetical protein n=1 Tax=Chitinophaga polysaccharea TaxID=1293035 RepID=UPI0014554DF0|nr:hypothetical protein [Chitinophaga polysaccharea]NLR62464.1 hypothetical protein [Chitinophaga polysaccharea]